MHTRFKKHRGGGRDSVKVPTKTEAQNLQMKTDKGDPITVKMAGVEVVWANVYEGKTGRATIADAGTLAFGDDYRTGRTQKRFRLRSPRSCRRPAAESF